MSRSAAGVAFKIASPSPTCSTRTILPDVTAGHGVALIVCSYARLSPQTGRPIRTRLDAAQYGCTTTNGDAVDRLLPLRRKWPRLTTWAARNRIACRTRPGVESSSKQRDRKPTSHPSVTAFAGDRSFGHPTRPGRARGGHRLDDVTIEEAGPASQPRSGTSPPRSRARCPPVARPVARTPAGTQPRTPLPA